MTRSKRLMIDVLRASGYSLEDAEQAADGLLALAEGGEQPLTEAVEAMQGQDAATCIAIVTDPARRLQ